MKIIYISKRIDELESKDEVTHAFTDIWPQYTFKIIFPVEHKYKVEEIKQFNNQLHLKQIARDENLAFIWMKSDTMSPICQNALLKTLEEADISIIFVVRNADSMLPTIQSRTIKKFDLEQGNMQLASDDWNWSDITKYVKLDRESLRKVILQKIDTIQGENIESVLLYQKALTQIDANCKIESILFNLVYQLQ